MADTVDGTNPAVEEGTPFPGADGDAANDGGGQPRIKRRSSLQAVKEAIKQQPLPNTKLVKYLFLLSFLFLSMKHEINDRYHHLRMLHAYTECTHGWAACALLSMHAACKYIKQNY